MREGLKLEQLFRTNIPSPLPPADDKPIRSCWTDKGRERERERRKRESRDREREGRDRVETERKKVRRRERVREGIENSLLVDQRERAPLEFILMGKTDA